MKRDQREKLYDGITNINDDIIEEAQETEPKRRAKPWVKWGAVAACLCLCAAVGSAAWFGAFGGDSTENEKQMGELVGIIDESDTDGEALASGQENNANSKGKESGVNIPAMELPELPEGADADMIGCLVYKGKVYTQAEYFEGDEIERISSIIGKKLGTAKGTLDEWSSQEEYSQEFAGTYNGDVYEVKGYGTDFRLCCIEDYPDGGKWMVFLEHLNGITLAKGEDLYGDQLHIKGNIRRIQYQTHKDWNKGKESYHSLRGLTDAQMDSFIAALYEGKFEDISQSAPEFYEEYGGDGFDDKYQQAHLYLEMKDGTAVELRVFENGYVKYKHMYGYYFVKVPEEIVAPLLSACK